MIESTPKFIQGIFPVTGKGFAKPVPLENAAYVVPSDKRSQLIYFRAGNSTNELVSVALARNGQPMRLFPIGAKASVHVPLAVVEDLFPDSKIEVLVGAPEGASGSVVLDIGFVEI
ncbi:MAG: hypothetical protein JOZ42_03875 [Acetobacteraceae bacterium]|nr:hypothetical protein [Acetobacteraceae bacterium]